MANRATVKARRLNVLEFLAAGLSVGEVAERLGTPADTIKDDCRSWYKTFGVRTQAGAVACGFREGLLT